MLLTETGKGNNFRSGLRLSIPVIALSNTDRGSNIHPLCSVLCHKVRVFAVASVKFRIRLCTKSENTDIETHLIWLTHGYLLSLYQLPWAYRNCLKWRSDSHGKRQIKFICGYFTKLSATETSDKW
jgi:hypothetical protein